MLSPVGQAKPQTVKKDEDLYEMAIQYKKEEDFAGWYTDVSCRWKILLSADEIGRRQRTNAGLLRYLRLLHSATGIIHYLGDNST